jgi:hypothetical protein
VESVEREVRWLSDLIRAERDEPGSQTSQTSTEHQH